MISDSPAAELDIEEGSVILKIDGEEMNDYRKFMMWIRLSEAGQEAVLEIKTPEGKTKDVSVVLGERGNRRGGLVY